MKIDLKQINCSYSRTPEINFEVNIVAKHVNAIRMTIMAIGVLLHWTQANTFELVVRQKPWATAGWNQEGRLRRSLTLKPTN